MVQQPDDLRGEIRDEAPGVSVEGCVLSAKLPLPQIELDNWLPQGHVLHDFDHRGDVIHLAWPIGIDANIRSGEDLQQIAIRNPAGEVDHIREVLLLHHLPEYRQFGTAADTGEVYISPPQVLEVQSHVNEDVEPVLCA